MFEVTVCIPTIPQRKTKLRKALSSVLSQSYPVASISIAVDHWGHGSAQTRNRALYAAKTEWVVFLDDDDQLLMNGVRDLVMGLFDCDADVVYGLPRIVDGQGNIRPRFFEAGGPEVFDPELLRQKSYIPVVSLVKTELAQACGGFQFKQDANGTYDDWGFYNRMLDHGATFHHILKETFIWNVDGGNTSGRPDKGDAKNG
ncbi:MAG: glycosyltransferase [Actinobacteria bacterium]|nr:glycosyltransferase [Actinomycetota bacterium]